MGSVDELVSGWINGGRVGEWMNGSMGVGRSFSGWHVGRLTR